MSLFPQARMPSLDGATEWLNSEPLDPAGLRGRVVLVDFWTLTCINWLRTEPYVRAWSRAYRDDGLIVVGVHTPEFSFEHDVDLVRRPAREREIDYPVAVDNDYEVWDAFANHYWPALYFVDTRGRHPGPALRRRALRAVGAGHPAAARRRARTGRGRGGGVEAEADWDHLRTPETYLGDERGERSRRPRATPSRARRCLNHWALTGEWTIGPENVVLRPGRREHRLPLPGPRCAPRPVRPGAGPVPFRVCSTARLPARRTAPTSTRTATACCATAASTSSCARRDAVRERTLQITFREPGAEAYAFTFG